MTDHDFGDERDPLLVRPFLLRDQTAPAHDGEATATDDVPPGQDVPAPSTWPVTGDGMLGERSAEPATWPAVPTQAGPATALGGADDETRQFPAIASAQGASTVEARGHDDETRQISAVAAPQGASTAGAHGADDETRQFPAVAAEGAPTGGAGGAGDETRHNPVVAPGRRHRGRRRLIVLAVAGLAVVLGAGVAGYAALRPTMQPAVSSALDDGSLPAATGPATTGPPKQATSPSATTTHHTRDATATTTAGSTEKSSTPASAAASSEAGSPTTGATTGQTVVPPSAPAQTIAPNVTTGSVVIHGEGGLCLDLNGGVPVDGNHIQVTICNGTGAQDWTLLSDGTLRVVGMCALIVGDNTVHIVACDGRTTAQWKRSGSSLVNAANGRCLTDPASGTGVATAVTVTRCTGAANQQWSLT